jgi:hypothetical protein
MEMPNASVQADENSHRPLLLTYHDPESGSLGTPDQPAKTLATQQHVIPRKPVPVTGPDRFRASQFVGADNTTSQGVGVVPQPALQPSKDNTSLPKSTQPPRIKIASKTPIVSEKTLTSINRGWRPTCLRRKTILAAAVLFSVLLISLATLFTRSEHNHGIADATIPYRYLWIYGPVAVFTAAAIAWAFIESDVKMMQPWIAMAKGTTSADKSILLDYVNTMDLFTLYHSVKNGEVLMSSCLGVKYILELCIVLSTGILVLESVPIQHPARACLTSFFTAQDMTVSLPYQQAGGEALEGYERQIYGYAPRSEAETVYQNQHVVQAFHAIAPPGVDIWNISTEVDVFRGGIQCQHAPYVLDDVSGADPCNYTLGVYGRL